MADDRPDDHLRNQPGQALPTASARGGRSDTNNHHSHQQGSHRHHPSTPNRRLGKRLHRLVPPVDCVHPSRLRRGHDERAMLGLPRFEAMQTWAARSHRARTGRRNAIYRPAT